MKANSLVKNDPKFLHETREEFKRLEDGNPILMKSTVV